MENIKIKRKTEEQDLYVQLQQKALRRVQELSGEVWTDYNEHDPGVTMLDALNYSLLESEYRLNFDLCDYLNRYNDGFKPQQHGFFLATEVFPVNPVTKMDYRRLFLSSIKDLLDVRVIISENGIYDFLLYADLDISVSRMTEIISELYALYHSHRNLCENVNRIYFEDYVLLYLDVDIEIDEAADANELTARIFLEVQAFLSRGIRFRNVGDLLAEGKMPEQILEGADQGRVVVDETSISTEWEDYDIARLYQKLGALSGVSSISSLNLHDGLRSVLEIGDEYLNYTLYPIESQIHQVRLKRKEERVTSDPLRVSQKFFAMSNTLSGVHNQTTDKYLLDLFPSGADRNFTHHNISEDLPNYYRNNIEGQFEQYLDMFDGLMTDSLDELNRLPRWMSTDSYYLSAKKERWMDLLDVTYGEQSNPACMRKYENDQERRFRRVRFLKDIPLWGLNRGKAMNLQDPSSDIINESGVETYLKSLLGVERYGIEMFLLEHNLLGDQNEIFTPTYESAFCITVIFAARGYWLHDDEFRKGYEQLLIARIPVHIRVDIYWKDKGEINQFQELYNSWKYALAKGFKRDLQGHCRYLKYMLANDYNWDYKV